MIIKHTNANFNDELNNELKFLIACCHTDPSEEDKKFINNTIQNSKFSIQNLLALANAHGILPLVYKTIKKINTDHLLESHNDFLSALKAHYMSIAQRNMLMSAELIRIMKLLEGNGIEALAFKGPVLAQMAYGDITLRQYGDLDILIRPDDLYKGVEILEQNGYASAYPLNKQQFKSYSDIAHDYALINQKNYISVELHWRLLSDDFMVDIDTINFFKDTSKVTIQGINLNTLQLEELIIYLCIHGAKHQWERLEWLVDIAYLTHTQSINWKRLSELTYQIHSEKMVMSALFLCHNFLKTDFPHQIEMHFQEPVIQNVSKKLQIHFVKHFSDSLNTSVQTKTISMIQLQLLHGVKNKFLFLTSLIKPTQLDYLSYPLPSSLTFLYYFIRPFNIMKRWSGKLSGKK